MKKDIAVLMGLLIAGFSSMAQANEVHIVANKPMKVTYRLAHQNPRGAVELGKLQTIEINKEATIPVSLDGYSFAGLVPVAIAGHKLPVSVNQFNKAEQCSMTTDSTNTQGVLKLTIMSHQAMCASEGGIFS